MYCFYEPVMVFVTARKIHKLNYFVNETFVRETVFWLLKILYVQHVLLMVYVTVFKIY